MSNMSKDLLLASDPPLRRADAAQLGSPIFVFFSSQISARFPTSFLDKNGSFLNPEMRPNVPKW